MGKFQSGRRYLLAGIVAVVATQFSASRTEAADVVAPMPTKSWGVKAAPISDWTYSITPYIWATAVDGLTTVKGRTVDVDVSPVDILEHTQFPKDLFGLMGLFEVRNGRFGLFADAVYMKIGINANGSRTRGTDAINGTVGASAGMKVEMFIAQVAAAYEVARFGATGAPNSGTAIDVYGGARGWWQSGSASVALTGTANIGDLTINGDGTATASGKVSWIDPLVGARMRHQFAPNIGLVVSGDVGGFGVGSRLSWQGLALLNYDFYVHDRVTWSGMLGYKALYVDYSRGSGLSLYEYDVTMHGPIFGVTARF